jgi:hypothetical protein
VSERIQWKQAKLKKLKTDNGLWELRNGAQVGDEFIYDPGSRQTERFYNIDVKRSHSLETILVRRAGQWGRIPVELLELEP